jgi:hypothetical protein
MFLRSARFVLYESCRAGPLRGLPALVSIDGWRAMALEELPFRGNSNATPPSEATTLADAISQLRKVLASELPPGLTTDYLVQLQNALEIAERAVRAERWAREVSEFDGE